MIEPETVLVRAGGFASRAAIVYYYGNRSRRSLDEANNVSGG